MSNAIFAKGTLIKIGDGGGSETFATIAEVGDLEGPDLKLDTIEVTNQSSPGIYKEFIAGLAEAGEVSFPINYQPSTATHSATSGLLRDLNAGNKRNFQIVWPPSGPTWTIAAFVTGFKPKAPVKDKLSADIKLMITGAPTLA